MWPTPASTCEVAKSSSNQWRLRGRSTLKYHSEPSDPSIAMVQLLRNVCHSQTSVAQPDDRSSVPAYVGLLGEPGTLREEALFGAIGGRFPKNYLFEK